MASWKAIDTAVAVYRAHITLSTAHHPEVQECEELDREMSSTWHVVFRCGTIVRVALDEGLPEFQGYGEDSTYPTARFKSAAAVDRMRARSSRAWAEQKETKGPLGQAVRVAYGVLNNARYPKLGAPESDRTVRRLMDTQQGDTVWLGTWAQAPAIASLATSRSPIAAHLQCGGQRRYDYIYPVVYGALTPELEWEVPITPESDLHFAARTGQKDEIARQLQSRGDPDQLHRGMTALSVAVRGDDIETVRLLIASRASPHCGNPSGLERAIARGNAEMVNAIVAADAKNRTCGTSMLHFAVIDNNVRFLAHLLRGRASPGAQDYRGETALTLAIRRGNGACEQLLKAAVATRTKLSANSAEFTPTPRAKDTA